MSNIATDARYLSYAAAAKYIGVSVGTLRRWAEAGRVHAHRIGEKLIRFDRAELDQLVHGGSAEGRAQ